MRASRSGRGSGTWSVPPRTPGQGRADQADCAGAEAVAQHGAQGGAQRRDVVSLRAQGSAAAEAGPVGGGAGAASGGP